MWRKIMTKQAEEIINICGFDFKDIRSIEKVVTSHTPKQILSLVRNKDPDRKHDFEWFLPFFKGYVKKILDVSVLFDDLFWCAYDVLDKFVDPFDVSLLPLVNEMSNDIERLEKAIEKSKSNIKYVYKVWSDIPETIVPEKAEKIEIRKYEVKTIKFA